MIDRSFVEAIRDTVPEPTILTIGNRSRLFVPALDSGRVVWVEQSVEQPDPVPPCLEFHALLPMVAYIRANADALALSGCAVVVDNHASVSLVGPLDHRFGIRRRYAQATATNGGRVPWLRDATDATRGPAGVDVERAVVILQTAFAASADRDDLLATLSSLVVTDTREHLEEGMAQTVTARTGIASKGRMALRPFWELAPRRSFPEIPARLVPVLVRLHRAEPAGVMVELIEGACQENLGVLAASVGDWLRLQLADTAVAVLG